MAAGPARCAARLAIGVNLVLFGMKYLFAFLSGSIALKAEAFHSLSDVIASCTVFAGFNLDRITAFIVTQFSAGTVISLGVIANESNPS
jgi:divalent metal cation (Fe/Co/Zn/Cd) transporter